MKLCTFDFNKHREIGLLEERQVVRLKGFDPKLPAGLKSFFARPDWRDICVKALASRDKSIRVHVNRVELFTPIPNPSQLFQINLNFPSHCAERGVPVPEFPQIFSKYGVRIISNDEEVDTIGADCELNNHVELCVVIGKEGLRIAEEEAMDHVAGYTVANHLTSVACQLGEEELWLRSNSPVVSGLLLVGPTVVTLDEFENPNDLNISCSVNRREEQNAQTIDMSFNVAHVIAFTSRLCRLYPGDLILMGTPAGVGQFRTPPRLLATEDSIVTSIEGIGELKNTIIFTDQLRKKKGEAGPAPVVKAGAVAGAKDGSSSAGELHPDILAQLGALPGGTSSGDAAAGTGAAAAASEFSAGLPGLPGGLGASVGQSAAKPRGRRQSMALAHLSTKQLAAITKAAKSSDSKNRRGGVNAGAGGGMQSLTE